MTSSFIVTLNLPADSPDQSSLDGYAADIMDSCLNDGLPVTDVKPWKHPTIAAVESFSAPLSDPLAATQKLF